MITTEKFQQLKVDIRNLCFKMLGDDDSLFTSRLEEIFDKYDKMESKGGLK